MATTQFIFLVPGFFGFAKLGDFAYFGHVQDLLEKRLRAAGVTPHVEPVRTHPTASIRTRARLLLDAIAETAGSSDEPIHLVGHSTGGVDARLLAGAAVSLGDGVDHEPYARRIRSVVTVASPHRGAPLAAFFASILGQRVLQLLTLLSVYGLRFGHVPLSFLLKLAAVLTRLDDAAGWRDTLVDQLFEQLLGEFTGDRRVEVEGFLAQVSSDQALLMQLTPDGMDLFNAGVTDRPGVRYGSVVTRAPTPSLRGRLDLGFDPYAQASYGLYQLIHRRTSLVAAKHLAPPTGELRTRMQQGLALLPTEADNDGIVPTLSQPWGELIAAVEADHLDIIGHFEAPGKTAPHVDWLCSCSGFDRPRFEQVWDRVARFMVGEG